MRFTLRLLGTKIFHVDTNPEPPEDRTRDLSGGTTASYPVQLTQPYREDSEPYEDE